MTRDRINALMAASYNLHVGPLGPQDSGMTPAKAGKLSRGDKAALCKLLADRGGSDFFTQAEAGTAFAIVVGGNQ